MKAAVIVFPGSNCDTDCFHVLRDVMKMPVEFVWHKENNFPKVDLVVLPGGFSYGDYLRTGAIARFSPAMESVRKHAAEGRYVIGICNGFQILLEAGLLPGAMLRNKTLSFICKHVPIRCENNQTAFTKQMKKGEVSEPLKTRFGYHIIKLTDQVPASLKEFKSVKRVIEERLISEKKSEIFKQLVEKLKGSEKINVDEKALETFEKKLDEAKK